MAEPLKVDEDQFKAVLRALLQAKPLPLKDIPRKREQKAVAKPKKKRG